MATSAPASEPFVFPDNLLGELEPVDSIRRWWALHTKPRQEKALARDLQRAQLPFYLPLVTQERLVRGRRVQHRKPLFDGYVFLLGDDTERVLSLKTKRVCHTLHVDDQMRLSEDLRRVQQLIEFGAALTVERRLEAGRRVVVKAGPLQGMEGVVIQRRGKTRLLVEVTFVQQGASVELEDFLVEPID